MKHTIFPNKVIQFAGTFLGAVILCTPLFYLQEKYGLVRENLFMSLFFVLQMGITCTFLWLVNKNRVPTSFYIFSLKDGKLLLRSIILILIFSLGMVPVINNYFEQIFNSRPSLYEQPDWILIIGAVVLAPVFEEMLFRQYFLSGLLSRYKVKTAILINVLLFALIHFKPTQIWPAVFYGLLTCIVFYKTRSITNTMLLHAIANGSTLLFVTLKSTSSSFYQNYNQYALPIVLLSVVLIVVLVRKWFFSPLALQHGIAGHIS